MKTRLLSLWLLLVFLLAGLPLNALAAISANTVWETRASGASDNNGGGFVAGSGGTDFSQQNGAKVAVGGGSVTSTITTTVVTFTGGTYTVLAGDLGNIVQFISGTNVTAGFYQITAVSAGLNGTWTLDRTPLTSGTTTNAVANMGGALATLAKLAGAMIASNKAFVTGAFTSTASNTFAQTVNPPTGASPQTALIGYGVTRGDTVHATLTLQTNTGIIGISATGFGFDVSQVDVDCASLGTSTGIKVVQNYCVIRACKVSNATNSGIQLGSPLNTCIGCEVTGCSINQGILSTNGRVQGCFVHDNTGPGIYMNVAGGLALDNLVCNNSGAVSNGIQVVDGCTVIGNTIHNNGLHGISHVATGTTTSVWLNNLITNNGGFGILGSNGTALPASPYFDGNAFFGNTSGPRSLMDNVTGIFAVNPYTNIHDVTLSASPYVGPTTGTTANFALNNVAGGGAACRKAGSPGTWPGNTGTTGFLDMGAVQSHSVIRRPFFGF